MAALTWRIYDAMQTHADGGSDWKYVDRALMYFPGFLEGIRVGGGWFVVQQTSHAALYKRAGGVGEQEWLFVALDEHAEFPQQEKEKE